MKFITTSLKGGFTSLIKKGFVHPPFGMVKLVGRVMDTGVFVMRMFMLSET